MSDVETDITLLCRQLLEGHRAERSSALSLDIAKNAVFVAPDQATSVATIVLEMIKAFDNAGASGIKFRISDDVDRVEILLEGADLGGITAPPLSALAQVLVNGSVEELRAQFTIERYFDGVAMRLIMPRGTLPLAFFNREAAVSNRGVTHH